MGGTKSKEKAQIKENAGQTEKEAQENAPVTLKGIKHLEDHPEYSKNGSVSFDR